MYHPNMNRARLAPVMMLVVMIAVVLSAWLPASFATAAPATALADATSAASLAPQPPIRIVFGKNQTSATVEGALKAKAMQRYVLRASAGQTMHVLSASSHELIALTVRGPGGDKWPGEGSCAAGTCYLEATVTLPTTGDYIIELVAGDLPSKYRLEVEIPPLPTNPTTAERVKFKSGATSAARKGTIPAGGVKRYVLRAQAGQTMQVTMLSDRVVNLMVSAPRGRTWRGWPYGMDSYGERVTITLPVTGDYTISLKNTSRNKAAHYTILFEVVPSSAEKPGARPERVKFKPGASSAERQGSLPDGGGLKRYVLGGAAGQILMVNVMSEGTGVPFTVRGPGGQTWEAEPLGSEVYIYALDLILPANGDYIVALRTPKGSPATLYTVYFEIE